MGKERNIIYCLKAYAIFSIICAHVYPISNSNNVIAFISKFIGSIGTFGVGIFFIISGYLFYDNKKNINNFIKRKLLKIVLPWLFVGTFVYIVVFIFKNQINFFGYITFIFGINSYLYYLTVLTFLYIIFYYNKHNIKFNFMMISVSIISNILTVLNYKFFNSISYINPLNWIIYFEFGLLISRYSSFEKIGNRFTIPYIFVILLTVLHILFLGQLFYFSFFGFVLIMISFISILRFIIKMEIQNNLILYIGKISFPIYLVHMPIAGIIVRLLGNSESIVLLIIRPVVTLSITIFVIYLYNLLLEKLKAPKIFYYIIGLK